MTPDSSVILLSSAISGNLVMPPFDHKDFDHHEQVLYCHDEATGLRGIIAIHSTALGPAAGGCRMYPYARTEDARLQEELVPQRHLGLSLEHRLEVIGE